MPQSCTFAPSDLNTLRSNARIFTRLFGLDTDPLHFKYSSGEYDAYDALDCAKILVKETERFVGRQKHVGKPFDFVEDVKSDMAEMLLLDVDPAKTAVLRKRHLPLFYLVVEPALETLKRFNHVDVINHADALFDELKDSLFHEDDYSTYDDAVVANAQVRQVIRAHEEQAKQVAAARKRKSRKVAKEIEQEIEPELDNSEE